MQIESRINQDTEISKQLSLWNQQGSTTYRGYLLVIPINNSILYIEPLYLQAETSKMPELKRVIASYQNTVVMENNLEEALVAIFGASTTTPTQQESDSNPVVGEESTVQQLAQQARDLYDQANQMLINGDWAGYGQNMDKLNEVLSQLQEITAE
jgi:uncharacterized membrane protein (UPF0182 family)